MVVCHSIQDLGSNNCPRSEHTFNPFAPSFTPQSLLVREQPTSIHYNGSCTRISDSRFLEGNQKYRGSKQFTRIHNKTYNHEERPFHLHQRRAIWSCGICFQMFHISGGCIINWAKKSKEDDNRWRCPTCQTKYDTIPYNYFCFCGKQRNPTAHVSEIPHSCGNTCGGKRSATCPHPCNEACHPGPCPECPVMLTRACNCGNVEIAVRCGSDIETKCDKVCNLLLECGIHRCARVCHEGECGPCKVMTQQNCFCGSSSRKILCWEKCSEKYSCGSPCMGIYTCGVHPCTRNCHLADESGCGSCPYSPERITHCPCGRCTLKELGLERTSCLDPIPTCKNLCRKVLKCGEKHRCRSVCHVGECPPCELNTSIVCRCKQVKRTLTCLEYLQFNCENEFLCAKRCKKRKSCGIHKCQELCCVQTEHFCLQVCNKRLSCGLHFCESICHAGQCPKCLNSSFEEQFCHCGRTVRLPPVPCGSSLPECSELCARPHRCSHPVTHRCHGEEHCPPCTVLVEKMCYGNHEIRRNVPCHIDAVSCGRPCGKPLSCGAHYCSRNCHSGDCVKNGEKCTRPCMVLRRLCEHPCALPCHGSSVCPESDCQYLVNVTCECGKHEIIAWNRAFLIFHLQFEKRNENLEFSGVGAMRRSASMEKLNCMSCDDECKKMARNKKFAEALELVTNEDGDLEREPTITFADYLKAELRSNASFVIEVERTFLELLEKLGAPTYLGTSLNHNFPPMSVEKRRFIHEYAELFLFQSISVDNPPKRSVIITAKRLGISRAPLVLLTSLQKHPSVLNSRGSITLRGQVIFTYNYGYFKKIREESHITRPTPLPQFNHFAVLRSDDEEYESVSDAILVHERDPHWWSDEEEVISPENTFEIVSLMEELVLKICNDMSFESHNEGGSCKDSWSDNE
ncbi:unnamed protein product [Angiostrongylus costaricensis]|uniref:R3H domain-containing protein n=1 Tax=Angiostrongylus costaricensis TaxID=334426 RepID=A0A3P7JPG6_ANGCS|nr:unnamed protein product [Angiostrongylus costaricensis]